MTTMVPSDCGVEYDFEWQKVSSWDGCFAPMVRACAEWTSSGVSEYHRFRVRVFYRSDNNEAVEHNPALYVASLENGVRTETLPYQLTPSWNHAFDDAPALNPEPSHFIKVSTTQYSDTVVKPFTTVSVGVDRSYLLFLGTYYSVKFWGWEISQEHPVAYTGHPVELTDFSDPPGLHDNAPAPSWMSSRLLIDAYNRILYDSTWMIQKAVFGGRVE